MGSLPVKPVSADPAEVNKPEKATKNRLTKKLNSVLPGNLSIKTNGSRHSSLVNGDYIKSEFLVYRSIGKQAELFLSNENIWVLFYRNGFNPLCKKKKLIK